MVNLEEEITLTLSGIILCMRPVNERRRHIVTSALIGPAHTQNDNCIIDMQHQYDTLDTVKCRYNAVFGVQEIDRVIAVTAL